MADIIFNGEKYHDDRLFVLHICKCTVSALDDQMLETVIHHEDAPADHLWCLVTYRNTPGYPATRVDHFQTPDEARAYMEKTEPTVPLISLAGSSPRIPLSYDEFVAWKARNGFRDFDYHEVYASGGKNPKEMIIARRR
jgi:hypothetical protein